MTLEHVVSEICSRTDRHRQTDTVIAIFCTTTGGGSKQQKNVETKINKELLLSQGISSESAVMHNIAISRRVCLSVCPRANQDIVQTVGSMHGRTCSREKLRIYLGFSFLVAMTREHGSEVTDVTCVRSCIDRLTDVGTHAQLHGTSLSVSHCHVTHSLPTCTYLCLSVLPAAPTTDHLLAS